MLGRSSSWNAPDASPPRCTDGRQSINVLRPRPRGPRPTSLSCRCPRACGVAGLRVRRRGFGRKIERRRDERGSLQHSALLGLRKGEKWRARKRTRVWQRMRGNPLRRARIWPTATVPVRRIETLLQKSKSQAEVAQQRCERFGDRQGPKKFETRSRVRMNGGLGPDDATPSNRGAPSRCKGGVWRTKAAKLSDRHGFLGGVTPFEAASG